MKFNYLALRVRMTQKEYTPEMLANAIDMKYQTLYAKMKNASQFKQGEIVLICKVLGIPLKDSGKYFSIMEV